ncbi:MAG: GDSL-type esterase/lipase family protein [Myxococcota bacterium]
MSGPGGSSGARPRWWTGLLALGLSSALMLGVLECGVRWVAPQDLGIWDTTRDGQVLLQPGIERHLASFDRTIRTNALGFRDREHAPEKPPGTFRVVLLGDSFMEALQVDFDQTFAHRLEAHLAAETGRTVEVVNAGVSGWGTDAQLTWLERRGLELDPDLVLLGMTLHNDVSDNLAMQFHVFQDGRLRTRLHEVQPWPEWLWLRLKIAFGSHSHLYRFVTQRLKQRHVVRAGDALNAHMNGLLQDQPGVRIQKGWAMTHALLDQLAALSKSAGARFAVFLIPINVQLTESIWNDFLARTTLPTRSVSRDRPQQPMRQWGRRSGVPVIDLLPTFEASLLEAPRVLYLPRDGHWNADAHGLAAGAVAESLVAQRLVPRSGS